MEFYQQSQYIRSLSFYIDYCYNMLYYNIVINTNTRQKDNADKK